jgi:hypothetical protein
LAKVPESAQEPRAEQKILRPERLQDLPARPQLPMNRQSSVFEEFLPFLPEALLKAPLWGPGA